MSASPTRRPRGVRLSPQDVLLLTHLGRVGWSLAADLALALGRSEAKVSARLFELRRPSWVDYDRPTVGPGAWRATTQGLRCAGIAGLGAPPLGAALWLHEVTAACLAAQAIALDIPFFTDRELRSLLTQAGEERRRWAVKDPEGRWHVPDLLLEHPRGPVAVELELAAKSPRRLQAILAAYARDGRRVLYLARPEPWAALERAEAALVREGARPPSLRIRPAPVASSHPRRPALPDAGAARAVLEELLAPRDRRAGVAA